VGASWDWVSAAEAALKLNNDNKKISANAAADFFMHSPLNSIGFFLIALPREQGVPQKEHDENP
jgi:hypothetical protein